MTAAKPLLAHVRVRRHAAGGFRVFPCAFFRSAARKKACRTAMAGGRWDGRGGWVVTADKIHAIVRRLREAGFNVSVDDDALHLFETRETERAHDLALVRDRLRRLDDEFRKRGRSLYPYQVTGATWLAERDRAHLGDQPGLGKTVQIIAALPSESRVVVVCPASIKGVWAREFATWRPGYVVSVLAGREAFRWPRPGEAVVLNYDILPDAHGDECPDRLSAELTDDDPLDGAARSFEEAFRDAASPPKPPCLGCAAFLDAAPEGVVLAGDEAHKLRGDKTLRTDRFRAMGRTVRSRGGRVWLSTGTPLVNRPNELWNLYEAADLAREAFGSHTEFLRLFGGKVKRLATGKYAGVTWGQPLPEAAERIAHVSLRRMRADVLTELPPRTWRQVPVEVSARDLAFVDQELRGAGLSAESVALALEEGREGVFSKLAAARAALATAKTRVLVDYVREEFEETGEPVVVFSAHRAPVDHLGKREGWGVVTGDVSAKKRTQTVDAFQEGKLRGIALTIGAGSEGITLTRAWNVVFVDRAWTPAENSQAEDRIYRIGQRNACVVTDLVSAHPLDLRVTDVLVRKTKLIAETVDAAAEIGRTG